MSFTLFYGADLQTLKLTRCAKIELAALVCNKQIRLFAILPGFQVVKKDFQ